MIQTARGDRTGPLSPFFPFSSSICYSNKSYKSNSLRRDFRRGYAFSLLVGPLSRRRPLKSPNVHIATLCYTVYSTATSPRRGQKGRKEGGRTRIRPEDQKESSCPFLYEEAHVCLFYLSCPSALLLQLFRARI